MDGGTDRSGLRPSKAIPCRVNMKQIWRISLSLLSAICGFVIVFLVGFYFSFLFGANIHDEMPGVFGLSFGLMGAILIFNAMNKRLSK